MKAINLVEGKRYETIWHTVETYLGKRHMSCYYEELDERRDSDKYVFSEVADENWACYLSESDVERFIVGPCAKKTIRELTDQVIRDFPGTRWDVRRINVTGRPVQAKDHLAVFEENTFEVVNYRINDTSKSGCDAELIIEY
ncbi:MAG: hypothetical protein IJ111_01350 [Eggerthellaceae bacterium]|nr:hypothetical protein [Eggerthellaceae bacterium]